MKYNNRILGLLVIIFTAMILTGCSSVFSAYISGQIFDSDEYDPSSDQGSVEGAHIYLYGTEDARDSDYNTWFSSGAGTVLSLNSRGIPPIL